jgi:hypothetical protein
MLRNHSCHCEEHIPQQPSLSLRGAEPPLSLRGADTTATKQSQNNDEAISNNSYI